LHEREIEGKVKENEENRGLNDEKASEDQFTTFYQFNFGARFYSFILSYSCTLRSLLEHSSFHLDWRKKAKGKQENSRE